MKHQPTENRTYIIPRQLVAEAKIFSFMKNQIVLYWKDGLFMIIWFGFLTRFKGLVYPPFLIPYFAFALVTGLFLVLKAKESNPGRRNWEVMLMKLFQSRKTYYTLKSPFMLHEKEREDEQE